MSFKSRSRKSPKSSQNGVRDLRRARGNYTRSTPLERIAKNYRKASKAANVAMARLSAWKDDAAIAEIAARATSVAETSESIAREVLQLQASGWVPPKKSLAVTFHVGDQVKITVKYRKKYLQLYSAHMLDHLTVTRLLPTGEIAVSGGRLSPFLLAKSHIERRSKGRDANVAK